MQLPNLESELQALFEQLGGKVKDVYVDKNSVCKTYYHPFYFTKYILGNCSIVNNLFASRNSMNLNFNLIILLFFRGSTALLNL